MIVRMTSPGFALLSALPLVLSGMALADIAPELTLGETINVVGTPDTATSDPLNCTAGPPVSCPTLRDAVRYANENGTLVDETFDMVVLSIGFQPHQVGPAGHGPPGGIGSIPEDRAFPDRSHAGHQGAQQGRSG